MYLCYNIIISYYSEGTEALSLSRKIKKKKIFCDKQTTVNKEVLMKKRKLKENKSTKDAEEYFQSNENVSTDVNDTSAFFTNFISTLPTTHNVHSSRQMLYEVKKKLHSLHNILQIYQDVNQSSEKLESTNQVDKPNTFISIKSEIKKDKSKLDCNVSSKVLQETRFSKMTNSCEYFELGCSRESLSSSIGNSSNASIKLLQKSAESDFSTLVTSKPHRRHSFSSNAILQEDYENKQKSSKTFICAQNISNWSCSNNSHIAFKVDKDATKIYLNAQSNNFNKKISEANRIYSNLSVKSFEDKNAQTKSKTSLMKEYDIANVEDVFDKNVILKQSDDLNEVLDSNDKKEKSTALLLQEALQFKKALLTQIQSNIKNRDFIADFSLKHNMQTTSNSFIANEGNQNCISETSSKYFSITDVAHNNDTTKSQISSSLSSSSKPLVYKNIITVRIPVGVKSLDGIDESETLLQTETILKNTQNLIKSRKNSEKNVADVNNLTKKYLSSVPKLQDLILTHVKNIRDYIDNFLESQNETLSAACKELQYRSKENIFHCSNEGSRTHLHNQFSTNPVISSLNNSSNLLINTCCKPKLFIKDETFKSCTDVCLKRNRKVFTSTSFENTFEKNTQWLETAEIKQKEMDLSLPIILKYFCKSDSKPTHKIEYYVMSKKNNKTHKQVIIYMDFQSHAQITKNEDIVKTTQTNDRSNVIFCNNSSYIINNNIASSKSMSNTKHTVKSNKEKIEVLIFDKSEKEILKKKTVILNSAAFALCLLLDIKRFIFNADSLLNNLNQNNKISANNYLQFKVKSDMSLLTNKNKGLNFSLKKSHSFSTRNDTLEHIRKLLRQSCTKLQNNKIKRIENTLQLTTRSTFIIPPRRTFIKFFIPKNHSKTPARRIKHQTQTQNFTLSPMLWKEKLYTKGGINKYLCAERSVLNLPELNVDKENSVKQSEKYRNTDVKRSFRNST